MAQDKNQFDVGAQRVGALYARALLGAGNSAGQTDAVLAEIDSLVDEVLVRWPDFQQLLASEMMAQDDKIAVLDRVFGGKLTPLTLDFLKVLARHGRLGNLRQIRTAAHQLHNEQQGRIRVEVTTAVPLQGDAAKRIADSLRARLNREPQLEAVVDKELIGGLKVRVGDTVFDATLATRLARMREEIRRRTVQHIETAKEKFIGV